MNPLSLPRAARVLIALATTLLVVPLALLATSTSVQAVGLDHEASYSCQYSGIETEVVPSMDGLPLLGGLPVPVLPSVGGSDTVGVEVAVDVPAGVTAGETLRIKGKATFTFGANATTTNASTVFTLVSDSFGLTVTIDGQDRFVRIAKLTTNRSAAGSPVVSASFTLPDVLVPSAASGRLTLSLPSEALATNPVSSSPASVAFTGLLRTDSRAQPNRAVGCALVDGQDTTLGSVAIKRSAQAAPTTPATAAPPAGSPGSGSTPAAPAAPGVDPTAPLSPLTPPTDAATPSAAPTAGATPAAAGAPESVALLAGEPIPPETVVGGLHLPPWTTVFLGAFVAGGLFLAVSSHRRLRQGTVVAAVLALLVVVPSPLNRAAPAEAASGQAQVTLVCVYQAEGSAEDARARDQPTGVSITLDVPDSVAPGDVISLTGSASVQAPEDIRSQAAGLGYNQLDAISDAFSVGLTVGSGKRQVFLADRWQTGKTAFSNPLVVRGPLYFPAFQVPADASGSIKLELPRNEVVDRRPKPYSNANTPPKVAVEFIASATGNGTSATYIVSCWRGDNGTGTIATIPVKKASSAPAGTAPSGGGTTSAQTPDGGGTSQQPGGTQPTTPGQTPSAGAPTAPGAVPTDGAPVAGAAPGTTATSPPALQGVSTAAAPAAVTPVTQDVVIPTWLAILAALLALGGYGYAGWNRLRLRSQGARGA